MPCGDHRDVSLLTIIPKCQGPPGLEIYDWQGNINNTGGGWIKVEQQSRSNECIVLAGELLHRLTAGMICPTSHRVTVKLNCTEDRISSPCELLLHPLYTFNCSKLFPFNEISKEYSVLETSRDYISRTSQTLVSVNK